MKVRLAFAAALTSIGLSASPAMADVLYDNLLAPQAFADPVGEIGPLADSFSTGPTAVNLVDVQLLLALGDDPSGSVTVQLVSDNNTSPGAVLATLGTLDDTDATGSLTPYDFPVSPGIALAANTRYWIELSTSNSSSILWGWSFDLSGPGVAGEFYFADGFGVIPNDSPYQMLVIATAVPEPSSLALGSLGAVGLAGYARRRRSPRA